MPWLGTSRGFGITLVTSGFHSTLSELAQNLGAKLALWQSYHRAREPSSRFWKGTPKPLVCPSVNTVMWPKYSSKCKFVKAEKELSPVGFEAGRIFGRSSRHRPGRPKFCRGIIYYVKVIRFHMYRAIVYQDHGHRISKILKNRQWRQKWKVIRLHKFKFL